jgi:hypothetical protein
VLKGLHDAILYLKGNKKLDDKQKQIFDIVALNSDTFDVSSDDKNPICNSFLSLDGKEFSYIDTDYSSKENIRLNESIFLSRAIGLRSSGFRVVNNNFYNVVTRDTNNDLLTREDVYAVCGLESVLAPTTSQQILAYLGLVPGNLRYSGSDEEDGNTEGGNPVEP